MLYSDGVRVHNLTQTLHAAAREMFSEIWLNHNVIYKAAKITKEDFGQYVDALLERSKKDPKTAAVAVDSTTTPPLLVSIIFAKDLHHDPVAEMLHNLPKSLEPIFRFNAEAVEHFKVNHALELYNKLGMVVYFLHGGTRDGYAGRYCDGKSISTRAGAFLALQWVKAGYCGSLGVSTHPEMIRRSEIGIQQNPQSICITTKPFATWEYQNNKIFHSVEGCAYVEFTSWKKPSHCSQSNENSPDAGTITKSSL